MDFLRGQGFSIRRLNYFRKEGEIDIIADAPDGTLVFAEVKTAFGSSGGDPAFWVTRKKQKQIGRVAELFLAENKIVDQPCRFDVLAVKFAPEGNPEIDYYPNAFML